MKSTCRTCKRLVYLKAQSCAQCGDTDPAYYREMRRTQKISVFIRTIIGMAALVLLYNWYRVQSKTAEVSNDALGEMAIKLVGGSLLVNLVIYLYSRSRVRALYEKAISLSNDEEAIQELARIRKAV